jgi:hypothetical protein
LPGRPASRKRSCGSGGRPSEVLFARRAIIALAASSRARALLLASARIGTWHANRSRTSYAVRVAAKARWRGPGSMAAFSCPAASPQPRSGLDGRRPIAPKAIMPGILGQRPRELPQGSPVASRSIRRTRAMGIESDRDGFTARAHGSAGSQESISGVHATGGGFRRIDPGRERVRSWVCAGSIPGVRGFDPGCKRVRSQDREWFVSRVRAIDRGSSRCPSGE